ncbi:MAG: SufD family Fe-S cluster assembly protein, partial [Schwartzia sp.]|nr:SufD family Fe-S cluster assembly protein [Schwartzia sp. (in: firmicutes)]
MAETKEQIVFSEIPMRTWRWLGVNEAKMPACVFDEAGAGRLITVPKGQKAEAVVVYRDELAGKIRVELEEGSQFHLVRAVLADGHPHADTVEVICDKDAEFRYTAVEAGGSEAASKLFVELKGDGSKADVSSLYFADGKRRVDLNYIIRQEGRHTDATMMVHGAMTGESEKVFRGTLDFIKGSEGSVGREREEAMLLSPKVRNRSVPLMLSGEADVDGHHAVSIGKMDEQKLFYLMSRGLDLEEAKKLVVEAAIAPVLARIPDKELADE